MAVNTPVAGPQLNAVPSPVKKTLATNYLNFTEGNADWAQQYIPETYEEEVERYGDRSVASFLRYTSAEYSIESDEVVWSEQGRLHLSFSAVALVAATGVITLGANHPVRVGATVVVSDGNTTVKGYVSAITSTTITVARYDKALFSTDTDFADGNVSLFVYGSEFNKGTEGMVGAVEPSFKSFRNKPVIIKDHYEVSGSDATQIGWVEIVTEQGDTGYMWYLKALGDTRTRFEDYLEMMSIEHEESAAGSGAATAGVEGSQGYFDAVAERGHTTAGINGDTDDLADFDEILKVLDTQGAIEENVLMVNRDVSLAIDDMLAAQNSYGAGGTSWGLFDNSADMALNLGFSGFRRGSYDFYKSDWKYLNDFSTRGSIGGIRGTLIPAGITSVYDKNLGKNIKRPFLHVRYRAGAADDRRMKSYVLGSVGARTSSLDAMLVEFLSERCLVTLAANNFMLIA